MKCTPRLTSLLLVLGLLFAARPADAQVQGRTTGLGGVIGAPTSGLTLKVYQNPGFAYDFTASWDLDDFFLLSGYGLFEQNLEDSPLNYFYGPGVIVGAQQHGEAESDLILGISGNFGINFFRERFEVFLQLTPRLNLIPSTTGDLGGGVGLRYYL